MKKIILPCIVALFCVACGGPQPSAKVAGAVFDISAEILATRASDTLVNLGPMRQGEVVLYNARLHNAGTEPMVITDIATSCGCTSVEYDKKPIPVGGEGAFSLRFDSRGMWGTQMKLVEIRTSASPHSFRLMLQADVTEE